MEWEHVVHLHCHVRPTHRPNRAVELLFVVFQPPFLFGVWFMRYVVFLVRKGSFWLLESVVSRF